jgi:hypothetical protein
MSSEIPAVSIHPSCLGLTLDQPLKVASKVAS